jgi:hypothetical protein
MEASWRTATTGICIEVKAKSPLAQHHRTPNFYMTKKEIHQRFIDQLSKELEHITEATKNSIAIATNDEHNAEGKYDTFSLETSYLARGQAKRVEELTDALDRLRHMPLKELNASTPIQLSALVRLKAANGDIRTLFFAPAGGGEEIEHGTELVTIVTPISPLGRAIVGKKVGTRVEFQMGIDQETLTIQSIE